MLQLCIAEEANLHQIKVKTIRSDHNNPIVAGSNYYIYATYSLQLDWEVRTAAAEKGTIPAKSHHISGTSNKRVFKFLASPSGLLQCFGPQSKTHQDYHSK
jgi:hypothetical protein